MLVREVMTAPAVTVSAGTPLREAIRRLDRHNITAMPVVDNRGSIVGVVSEADLVTDAVPPDVRTHMMPVHVSESVPARVVAEVMTTCPRTVGADSDLADAVDLMSSTVVKSLPVLDGGRVVGMVSRSDVVHVLARRDDTIRLDVDELVRSQGADWLVDVTDGVVGVWGPVGEHERRVAEVLAGSVAGVVAVHVR